MNELSRQAHEYRIGFYLVADQRDTTVSAEQRTRDMRDLAAAARYGVAIVAEDAKAVLATTYQATGLTAVLVHADGVVDEVLRDLPAPPHLERRLEQLQS